MRAYDTNARNTRAMVSTESTCSPSRPMYSSESPLINASTTTAASSAGTLSRKPLTATTSSMFAASDSARWTRAAVSVSYTHLTLPTICSV